MLKRLSHSRLNLTAVFVRDILRYLRLHRSAQLFAQEGAHKPEQSRFGYQHESREGVLRERRIDTSQEIAVEVLEQSFA